MWYEKSVHILSMSRTSAIDRWWTSDRLTREILLSRVHTCIQMVSMCVFCASRLRYGTVCLFKLTAKHTAWKLCIGLVLRCKSSCEFDTWKLLALVYGSFTRRLRAALILSPPPGPWSRQRSWLDPRFLTSPRLESLRHSAALKSCHQY